MSKPNTELNLENLSEGGQPPESRLNDAAEVATLVQRLANADERRAQVRAKLKGLVDGNSPYSSGELRSKGQSYRCNINFRESENFLSMGLSAFYDVFSEAPTYANVRINASDANESEVYSRIITEEFDRLQKQDDNFDYLIQLSQHEMVLYGYGPMIFEDDLDWRCKAVRAGDILVPEGTKSNVNDWTVCVIRSRYQVHELYSSIRNEEGAAGAGWNVAETKKSIMQAAPEAQGGSHLNWEYYQQQLRNNDLSYSSRSDVITAAHVFYREFPTDEMPEGGISHCIIDERGHDNKKFLFRRVRRYKSWNEAIHCLFYDKGDGTFHSVKGMGVKMFGAMEIKNRLRCSLVDAAFTRAQIMLQPTTPDALNKTSLIQMGPMAVLPPGYNVVQQNVSGALDSTMSVATDLEGLLQANLSQYRQRLEKQGNPRTATEVEAIVGQQATLGKTQLNRYYEQLDALFAERYRRATSSNVTKTSPGGAEALDFQKRCRDRGVPAKVMREIDYVRATRTVGRGSVFERRSVMRELMDVSSMLPESGRANVIEDTIASMVGYQNVERYYPKPKQDIDKQEQVQEAMRENALFKLRVPIPVSDLDSHVTHAESHLSFGAQAAESISMGGDLMEVATVLKMLLPHLAEHLQKLGVDEGRKEVFKLLNEQAGELAKVANQIVKQVQQQQQQQQQQQAAQQQNGDGLTPEAVKAMGDEDRKSAAHAADLQRKGEAAQQELSIRDARAAAEIRSR